MLMNRRYVKNAAIAVLSTAALVGLAACAPQQASQSSGTEGAFDGVVNVGLSGSVSTLDISHETGILNYYIAQVTSEGLLAVNAQGELIPAIAQSWNTDDGVTWTFQIRQDAKFHDGNPVTMEDVLFSINLGKDPEKSPSSAVYWPSDATVEQTGDWEVTITLPAAAQNFGWTVTANGGLWITEKSFYEAASTYGSSQDLIMGTGPYQVTEFQPDSHVTLKKVDTWWGGKPEAETIQFDFFADENTRLFALQSGALDIALQVPTNHLDQYEAVAGTTIKTESDRSYVGLTFDAGVEPFNDIHVRKAIAHAVDRESIVSSVLSGSGTVATGLEPADQLGTQIGVEAAGKLLSDLPNYTFDMEAAVKELKQSSVPEGFDAELLYPSSVPQLGTAALAIADNLKELGINLTVTSKPVEEWITTLGTGQYGLNWMSYTPTTGDAAEIPGWLLGPQNPARYENTEVQDLIAASNAETDPHKRAEQIIEANKIAQENVIYSPVWWGKASTAFASTVSPKDYTSFYFMTPWAVNLDIAE